MKHLLLLLLLTPLAWSDAADLTFYIGTYTGKSGSKGIYKCALDSQTGKLGSVQLAATAENPAFLAITPDGQFLYAANDSKDGSAMAFRVEKDRSLTALNQESSGKGGVSHIWYDSFAHSVLAASYSDSSIAAYKTKADGSLTERTDLKQFTGSGPDKVHQESSHPHSVYSHAYTPPDSSRDSKIAAYVYACDLGSDKVWIFQLNNEGKLIENDPAFATVSPGAGPRHLAFTPNGKYAYVANELKHTVTAFAYDSKNGALEQFQDITTLPAGLNFTGAITTSEIYCHPSGKWLYVTNRGYDSIAVYSIASDGKLTWVQDMPSPVKFPRGFGIDPSGKWLMVAGEHDNKISPLKIDQDSGKLTATDQTVEVGEPVCVLFAPAE
jgi:6-phosphogluconolactonase